MVSFWTGPGFQTDGSDHRAPWPWEDDAMALKETNSNEESLADVEEVYMRSWSVTD